MKSGGWLIKYKEGFIGGYSFNYKKDANLTADINATAKCFWELRKRGIL